MRSGMVLQCVLGVPAFSMRTYAGKGAKASVVQHILSVPVIDACGRSTGGI